MKIDSIDCIKVIWNWLGDENLESGALVVDRLKESQFPAGTSELDQKLYNIEREVLIDALEKANYKQSEAAKILGIHKVRVHRLIAKHNIKSINPKWTKNKLKE